MKARRVNLSLAVVMLILITLYLLQTNCLKSSRETAQDAMQLVGCQLLFYRGQTSSLFFSDVCRRWIYITQEPLEHNQGLELPWGDGPSARLWHVVKCGPQPAELMQLTAASSWNQRRQPETFTNCANNTFWFTHRMMRMRSSATKQEQ